MLLPGCIHGCRKRACTRAAFRMAPLRVHKIASSVKESKFTWSRLERRSNQPCKAPTESVPPRRKSWERLLPECSSVG